jgi:hypothetical protein
VVTERKTVLPTRDLAWAFLYQCDHAGIMAGYPSPNRDGTYTVAYLTLTAKEPK